MATEWCVWLEPANSFWPPVSVTERALPMLEPSFARLPSTVTSSPIFIELRDQPWRMSPFGLPISMPQFVTLPDSSFTSM